MLTKTFVLIFLCLLSLFNLKKIKNIHLEKNIKKSLISFQSPKTLKNFINLLSDTEINLYALNTKYETAIQIPSNYQKIYQIPGTNCTYKRTNGYSVGVTSTGTVYPENTTYYWYGNRGYNIPREGETPTKITTEFETGKSTISITSSDKTVTTIIFNVLDYAIVYADNVLLNFLKNNITNSMTEYEKYKKITSFPAQYPYSQFYYDYVSMIIFQGGDCWASSYTILKLCEFAGIKAHLRYGVNDPGGSGHRNVAALIDGKIYVAEAGFSYFSPNRPYYVSEENVGFFIKKNDNTKTARLFQYDGYEENIIVPEKIDNYTINEIYDYAFYYGKKYSGMNVNSIKLPDTIEIIGNSSFFSLDTLESIKIPKNVKKIGKNTFSGCSKIEKIELDNENKYFYSDDGVLYNYDKTKLLAFPTAKNGEYVGLTSLTEVDDYCFYNTTKINKLTLPGKINKVGNYAFTHSPLKEIYFAGPQPQFGIGVFEKVNATVYYPKNRDWKTKNINISNAIKISFEEWDPPQNLSFYTKSYTWIWVLVIIILVLILGFVGYIVYKKKFANSLSLEGINAFSKLLK